MDFTEALWVLERAHTRDGDPNGLGYTVEMVPAYLLDFDHGAYIEAWGVVRDYLRSDRGWKPMNTAPKGSGDGNSDTREPGYVAPPKILLRFGSEAVAIAHWDWYYAEGGHGYRDGFAWIGPECGEPLNLHYSEPDGWMELPK